MIVSSQEKKINIIDEEIAALVEIDNEINQEEIELYQRKRIIRTKLRDLRKMRRSIVVGLGRNRGRQPIISIEERRQQVKNIKALRRAGRSWREVANALGYKNHPECIRILNVFGNA